jgi:hypothetical protein
MSCSNTTLVAALDFLLSTFFHAVKTMLMKSAEDFRMLAYTA